MIEVEEEEEAETEVVKDKVDIEIKGQDNKDFNSNLTDNKEEITIESQEIIKKEDSKEEDSIEEMIEIRIDIKDKDKIILTNNKTMNKFKNKKIIKYIIDSIQINNKIKGIIDKEIMIEDKIDKEEG